MNTVRIVILLCFQQYSELCKFIMSSDFNDCVMSVVPINDIHNRNLCLFLETGKNTIHVGIIILFCHIIMSQDNILI